MFTSKTITKEVSVIDEIACDNCETKIVPMYEDIDRPQGKNMLNVVLHGGYGEYIDGCSRVHLCKQCADQLKTAFPLFKKVLENTAIGFPDWRVMSKQRSKFDTMV